jgi:hypothetical protein
LDRYFDVSKKKLCVQTRSFNQNLRPLPPGTAAMPAVARPTASRSVYPFVSGWSYRSFSVLGTPITASPARRHERRIWVFPVQHAFWQPSSAREQKAGLSPSNRAVKPFIGGVRPGSHSKPQANRGNTVPVPAGDYRFDISVRPRELYRVVCMYLCMYINHTIPGCHLQRFLWMSPLTSGRFFSYALLLAVHEALLRP